MTLFSAQNNALTHKSAKTAVSADLIADVEKVNDSIPNHIPFKKEGKFGFINQEGKTVIQPIYNNVGFFTED